MAKTLTGTVVSTKMNNTVVVEVSRLFPHPIYKKRLTRSKKYKVDTAGQTVSVGARVKIVETPPMSKDKHFKIASQIEKSHKVVKEEKN